MSLALLTRGVICRGRPGTGTGEIVYLPDSGGGGGAGLERPKPVVRVTSIKYDKEKEKKINIILKDIKINGDK